MDSAVVLTYTDGLSASLRGGIGLEAYAADGARFDDTHIQCKTAVAWAREVEKRTNNKVRITVYPSGSLTKAPQCYDGVRNGDESGVDCGGACPNQDCCTNRAWDTNLGEGGADCGGSCALTCQPADRLDRWTQTNGPWLEYVKRIRFDPDDPQTLLAASNTGRQIHRRRPHLAGNIGRYQPNERLWPGAGPCGQKQDVCRHS